MIELDEGPISLCMSCKSEDGGSGGPRIPCDGALYADGTMTGGCGEPCSFIMDRDPQADRIVYLERIAAEAAFLLDRLAEWGNDNLTDDAARDWFGHVSPSEARLRNLLAPLNAPSRGKSGE